MDSWRPKTSSHSRSGPGLAIGPATLAARGLVLGVQLGACSPDSSRACDTQSDCFAGEICQNGSCSRAVGDTGRSEVDTGAVDGGPVDSGENGTPDTAQFDTRSDSGGADTDTGSAEDVSDAESPDADGEGGSPSSLGEACGSAGCKEGTCIEGTCVHAIGVTNEGCSGALNGVEGADQK